MPPNPASATGTGRSQATLIAATSAVGAVGGLIYWIRNKGTEATSSSANSAQSSGAGADRKNDEGIQETVKGAYGGKTGGNTSLGQRPAS